MCWRKSSPVPHIPIGRSSNKLRYITQTRFTPVASDKILKHSGAKGVSGQGRPRKSCVQVADNILGSEVVKKSVAALAPNGYCQWKKLRAVISHKLRRRTIGASSAKPSVGNRPKAVRFSPYDSNGHSVPLSVIVLPSKLTCKRSTGHFLGRHRVAKPVPATIRHATAKEPSESHIQVLLQKQTVGSGSLKPNSCPLGGLMLCNS